MKKSRKSLEEMARINIATIRAIKAWTAANNEGSGIGDEQQKACNVQKKDAAKQNDKAAENANKKVKCASEALQESSRANMASIGAPKVRDAENRKRFGIDDQKKDAEQNEKATPKPGEVRVPRSSELMVNDGQNDEAPPKSAEVLVPNSSELATVMATVGKESAREREDFPLSALE